MTDATFLHPIHELRSQMTRETAPVYSYRLDYRTEVLGGILGAHHSLDLRLVFDTAGRTPVTGSRPRRLELAREMADAWSGFARSGDPSHAGIGPWRPWSEAQTTFVFGEVSGETRESESDAVGLLSFA
jgi:para-nitrobenzyl esterase